LTENRKNRIIEAVAAKIRNDFADKMNNELGESIAKKWEEMPVDAEVKEELRLNVEHILDSADYFKLTYNTRKFLTLVPCISRTIYDNHCVKCETVCEWYKTMVIVAETIKEKGEN